MRKVAAYLPSITLTLIGAAMFGALVAGFDPYCHCTGVCGCPAEVGPPFPLLTLVVLGSAGLLAAGTHLVRRSRRTGNGG